MSRTEMDSRDYIIPFSLQRETDLPADFTFPPEMPREFAGIFLPQDRDAPAARSSPPCAVILAGERIWIVTRRIAGHLAIPLARLEVLECGRILLLGWIGLQWDGGARTLWYNCRSAPIVEMFLGRLKNLWLGRAFSSSDRSPGSFGAELNLKFRNAASTEMLQDEARLLQFFQPPVRGARRRFLLRRETRKPADLLMLSDRRLLWITDRAHFTQEPYGTVSKSAALHAVTAVRTNTLEGRPVLEVALRFGTSWIVPVAKQREEEANAFAESVGRTLHSSNHTIPAKRR